MQVPAQTVKMRVINTCKDAVRPMSLEKMTYDAAAGTVKCPMLEWPLNVGKIRSFALIGEPTRNAITKDCVAKEQNAGTYSKIRS
jgi:hypothetical protein